jgi:hypothetical protein
MNKKTYSIFGAGAAGLYTAWRLLNGQTKTKKGQEKKLKSGDVLELYDWGQYDFSKKDPGSRAPGARICTWHYNNDKNQSYLELGGMRYALFDEKTGAGHLLVSTVIQKLGLDVNSIEFNESSDQLLYLRNRNLFLSEINSGNPAPYNVLKNGQDQSPYNQFTSVQNLAATPNPKDPRKARKEWCKFYASGFISNQHNKSSVFKNGDSVKNLGYWNLMYDQLGSEGYAYVADANGYTSNVINWNSAVAFNANNEFAPGTQYKTLKNGYSSMFNALFDAIETLAKQQNIQLNYFPNTRLHSIYEKNSQIYFATATRQHPWKIDTQKTCNAAWLAMGRAAIDTVAQATRYQSTANTFDLLNQKPVQLYLDSTVMQPSYKVGLFFSTPWWLNATYAPKLKCFTITDACIAQLKKLAWPKAYVAAIEKDKNKKPADQKVYNKAFDSEDALVLATNNCIANTLSFEQQAQLFTSSVQRSTIGPSFTDTPVRMAVYFGNNALEKNKQPVYGMLASYDDEYFTTFWKELEEGPKEEVRVPENENIQPLNGPKKASDVMIKMLRKQLAEMHYGPGAHYTRVPEPLEAAYMDWSLPPFNAGYHAWAAHYNVGDVQRKIRKPSQLVNGKNLDIFIVGEAYSNDQAWVEGAYCTSESVLNDFFDIEPIVANKFYPFICPE